MYQSFKDRLAGSGSLMILASLAATAALTANVSAAAAQTDQPSTRAAATQLAQAQTAVTANASSATVTATADTSSTASASSASDTTAGVGELVVTARLREESVQKVPETVAGISPQILQNNEITNFFQLQGFAPSVSMQTLYIKDYSTVEIRGFAAAVYFNETAQQLYSLYDLAGVSITNGPQGTLFGYTALGGAVQYTPMHPQMNAYGAGVDLSVGNLNTTNINGYVNIPIVQDQLAMRISWERDHTDGYTSVQGSSVKLDSNDNEGFRVGVQWDPGNGRFTNYSLVLFDHQDDTSTSRVTQMWNPLSAAYQQSGRTVTGVAEPGPSSPATFAAYCTPAIITDVWAPGTTTAQCEAQHLAVLNTFDQQTFAALALARASGNRAIPAPSENGPLLQLADDILMYDIANYDVVHWGGFLGGGDIQIHNIANYQIYRNYVNNFAPGAFDYYAASGSQTVIPTPLQLLQPGTTSNPTNGYGNPELGNYNYTVTDEIQIHGTLDTALGATPGLTYVLGFYNYAADTKANNVSSQNIPMSYDGAYNPDEGPVPATAFPEGYWQTQFGQYLNATADAGMLWKPLTGLHFTGGIRFSEIRTSTITAPVLANYAVPAGSDPFYPSTARTHTLTDVKPVNWSASVDYTASNNMVYANASYIVVPGFANAVPAVPESEVPGYVPFAGNEELNDYEIGDKWSFDLGGMRGTLDIDGYYEDFANIQTLETIFVPAAGTYASYYSNPGSQHREGIEWQAEIFPTPDLDVKLVGDYADAHYSSYLTSDPLGYLKSYSDAPGAVNSPLCVAGPSKATITSGTTGTCIMNFASTPVPLIPDWQLNLQAAYTVHLEGNLGNVVPNLTVNWQSREFFTPAEPLLREEELIGPGVAAAESSPAHVTVNMRLEWDKPFGNDNLTAALWVTNLTNADYAIGGIDTLFAIGVASETFNPPREFGFELSAKW